jgi:ribosomal protein S18 acetylase RimI-like enzyme
MEHAEQIGSAAGCEFVELTSAMNRAEAHAFYRSIGYETNSFRFHKSLVRR